NNNTTNIYKTNFFEDFFSNIRLMDVNSKGALLFKIAIFIIVIDTFLYMGFRTFGYTYAPFVGSNDHLGQLLWAWIIFTWPMSFVLPLLIKHWSVYVITLMTFRGVVGFIFSIMDISDIQYIDSQSIWIIKTLIALVLTLGYAWIVKTYLRNPPKTTAKVV
ncbi:MAG: hypothetical protein FWE02_03665, partial [Defluviitaleaceae bacterium]|nr:hypothetical protein [Defluviitaleaceae bacterium]